MISSSSQALQDTFAHLISQQTGRKTYIEIGGNQPQVDNNSYILESQLDWQGFSVELNQGYAHMWTSRRNQCYFDNAMNFDYVSALRRHQLPMRLGYLSCDIEPPAQTFTALHVVLDQGIDFDCITFEHDLYASDTNFDNISRKYLTDRGYKVAVTGVYPLGMPGACFETWYVRADINFPKMSFDQYRALFNT